MSGLPNDLQRLLSGDSAGDAWEDFVAEHSRLLLHVARSVSTTHDDALDAYAYVLERLHEDDCRRLREFASDPRSKFTTWLVVVARRLCVDLHRRRYGRARGADDSIAERRVRRRLQDLAGDDLEVADVGATGADSEQRLRETELRAGLSGAVAALDSRDQLLIRLRFHDDLAAREIARLMHFPSPFHVYRRIGAVLADLRRALRRRGIEGAAP